LYICIKKLTREARIDALVALGDYLRSGGDTPLEDCIQQAWAQNGWFNPEHTRMALGALADRFLTRLALEAWLEPFPEPGPGRKKTIGIVMAGNIPLVGFHDWLSVFAFGHRAVIKCSEKDSALLPFLVRWLGEWQFETWAYTEFQDRLSGFDAVIATGSNNTARYFEQYFGRYPHIIRKNRNSIAILDGSEDTDDLLALGTDVFRYYGLGCRNVSKLYLPEVYDLNHLLEVWFPFHDLVLNHKYKNNYDYHFSLYLLNRMPFLYNGCIMLREDPALAARIATLHYGYYSDLGALEREISSLRGGIQCMVGKASVPGLALQPFGSTQEPGLTDYPDGVDILAWLAGGL
jgi:hypothetical protein